MRDLATDGGVPAPLVAAQHDRPRRHHDFPMDLRAAARLVLVTHPGSP